MDSGSVTMEHRMRESVVYEYEENATKTAFGNSAWERWTLRMVLSPDRTFRTLFMLQTFWSAHHSAQAASLKGDDCAIIELDDRRNNLC